MIIADFKSAIETKNFKEMSECFSTNGRIFDYCPEGAGKVNSFIFGKKAVDMFYHNKFYLDGLSFQDPKIIDERTLDFYGNYGGALIHAIATIETYDTETGLINEMVIRPA